MAEVQPYEVVYEKISCLFISYARYPRDNLLEEEIQLKLVNNPTVGDLVDENAVVALASLERPRTELILLKFS